MPSSCALLGGFAIGARFRCCDNTHVCKLIALYTASAYSAEHELSASACIRSMAGFVIVVIFVFISRVPCTKVLSQEIQIFQETSFCVFQVLLRNFTNALWQLYIDFYTIEWSSKVLSNCVLLKFLV